MSCIDSEIAVRPDVDEIVSRFVTSKRLVRADGTVKYGAYLPHRTPLEVSVYRTLNMNIDCIWDMGDTFVVGNMANPKEIVGAAQTSITQVSTVSGLSVDPAPQPHARHANIVGWPPERDKIRVLAAELADKSTYTQR